MFITQATPSQAAEIARLIMRAMNEDCCQYFAGKHSLEDFHRMMTMLVAQENSQYSYTNTLVAMHDDQIVGICTSYDGARLHQLREAFIAAAKTCLERDFSAMDDETSAGELYVDSLAVVQGFEHQGIATALLKQTIAKAKRMQLPAVGLLVDQGNPKAERLYTHIGFQFVNTSRWGGHPMKHLQYIL